MSSFEVSRAHNSFVGVEHLTYEEPQRDTPSVTIAGSDRRWCGLCMI